MKILYYIYQICIALPILLVLTILTAIVTIIGSLLGGAHIWGYYPGKIWSQLICLFLLIPVKVRGREKLHGRTSYIFVPNHQGSSQETCQQHALCIWNHSPLDLFA